MYAKELEVAINAAHRAAHKIRAFDQNRTSLGIRSKEKYDLVTDADVASEIIIRQVLSESFPSDAVLGEEESVVELTTGRRWIVDPIDGTTNFAHGFPPYCISIALYEDMTPCVGVVLEISRNELFTAVRGGGTHMNGEKVGISSITEPSGALIGTGFPVQEGVDYTSMLKLAHRILSETEGLRRPGSAAYDLCCVAAGRLDAFYELNLKPWDVAAGALLVMEAGGVVSDFRNGGDWLHGRQIVAGNPSIQPWLQKCIYETAPDLQ
jgi:myo-inositol-1(or 4)-monophosphatase